MSGGIRGRLIVEDSRTRESIEDSVITEDSEAQRNQERESRARMSAAKRAVLEALEREFGDLLRTR